MVSRTEKAMMAQVADAAPNLVPIDNALFRGVRVVLEARLGRSEMTIEALTSLQAGSVVPLETGLADHVDLYVNDARVARGEVVAVGDCYGVRLVEVG